MRVLMTALLLCSAVASAGAQSAVTIDPGMNLDQVITKLGEPASVRTYEGHTYLYYKNACEKTDAAAKEKKTEAAPAEMKETKPDTSATKKDSTTKAPAKPPAGHEG
jgi:outer membrane protein assembly factor BamE (lipoprotein component of BamABCDE complex)